jgi:hypothetical protein
MADLKLKNYKGTEQEFEALSLLEKREYIIQTKQENTLFYVGIAAKIYLISLIVSFIALATVGVSTARAFNNLGTAKVDTTRSTVISDTVLKINTNVINTNSK